MSTPKTEPLSLPETLAANLRRQRAAIGMSQEALALAAGLDRSFVGKVERGAHNISLASLERLASALNVPAHTLLRSRRRGVSDEEGP